jgi:AraC family ethanolamine operon transcriptional activator
MESATKAGIIHAEDVDEHREAVRPWDVAIRQVSPGKYRAKTEYSGLNRILLYREHCSRRLMVTGATPAGYLVLGIPWSAGTKIDWCGGEINRGRLAFGRSSTEIDCVIPEGSRHLVLMVPEDLVRKHLGEVLGSRLSTSECRHLICHPSIGESLIQLVNRLVDRHLERPELLADPRACEANEAKVMDIFSQAFATMDREARGVPVRARRQSLLRAVEYAEQLRRPIGVAELAVAASVSRRVLELAFKEALGVTPVTYLRWRRMHGVHRELVAAAPDSARVKDIAAQWGFSEPGRFAVAYRRLFGESPSETLTSSRRPPPRRLEDVLRG